MSQWQAQAVVGLLVAIAIMLIPVAIIAVYNIFDYLAAERIMRKGSKR